MGGFPTSLQPWSHHTSYGPGATQDLQWAMMIHLVIPPPWWFSPVVPPFFQICGPRFCCRPLLEDLANNAFQTGGAQKARGLADFLGPRNGTSNLKDSQFSIGFPINPSGS